MLIALKVQGAVASDEEDVVTHSNTCWTGAFKDNEDRRRGRRRQSPGRSQACCLEEFILKV